jgi:hypothetical protein
VFSLFPPPPPPILGSNLGIEWLLQKKKEDLRNLSKKLVQSVRTLDKIISGIVFTPYIG